MIYLTFIFTRLPPVGDFIGVGRVYRFCSVMFIGYQIWTNLVILDMINFEIIIEMSSLSLYHTILDCHAKTTTVAMSRINKLESEGDYNPTPMKLIFIIRARRLVKR